MTTENFTRENVLKALAEVVDEKGADYRFDSDQFGYTYSTPDGKGACIVGCVLEKVAPETFKELHEWQWTDEQIADGYTDRMASFELNEFDAHPGLVIYADTEDETFALFDALRIGQNRQDDGNEWGQVEDQIRAILGEDGRHNGEA